MERLTRNVNMKVYEQECLRLDQDWSNRKSVFSPPSSTFFRGAEIMYSMMWAEMEYVGSDVKEMATAMMERLVMARQNLALFQHHDGVTGTAKDHVVKDYADRCAASV